MNEEKGSETIPERTKMMDAERKDELLEAIRFLQDKIGNVMECLSVVHGYLTNFDTVDTVDEYGRFGLIYLVEKAKNATNEASEKCSHVA